MTRFALAITLLVIGMVAPCQTVSAGMITVNFDDVTKWTAGSAGIGSYASNHVYADQGFTFTGGPGLRDTTTDRPASSGIPGALGTHSWRLRDVPGDPVHGGGPVAWTATYTTVDPTVNQIGRVSFDARRWDGSPSPAFDVSFSSDGGTSFSASQLTLNNDAFDNSSDWKTFSFFANTPVLVDDNFIVRFASTGTTERIMIDNFSVTAVPEPTSLVMVALAGMGGFAARRFNKKKKLERVAMKSSAT